MMTPELPLAVLASAGCTHMLCTDARSFEINPYAAFVTAAAGIYLGALHGTSALASSLLGVIALAAIVAAIRWISPRSIGLGDYSLLAACGALTGLDTLIHFLLMTSAFGVVSSVIAGRLRPRKRLFSVYPLATAAIPAVLVATILRYHYGVTFLEPFPWFLP